MEDKQEIQSILPEVTRDEKRMHQLLPSKPGGSPITRGFAGLTTAIQQCSRWPLFTPEKPVSLIRYGGPLTDTNYSTQ